MRKFFLLLFLLLIAVTYSISQNQNSSLLWEVSGNGLQNPSYVFGTIHVICPNDLIISPTLVAKLKSSSKLILELDMDDPHFMVEMQQHSFNEGMENISETIDPVDLAILNDYLIKNYNTEMAQMGVFKPMVLMSLVMLKTVTCQEAKSIETELMKLMTMDEKEILGLESVADQFDLFDQIPAKEQVKWVIDMIEDSIQTKIDFQKMTEAYKEGDIDAIYDFSNSTYPEFAKYEDVFLKGRNEKWIPSIIEFVKNDPVFIAVGAAHLGAENGVISLLKAEGYNVDPIQME